MTARGVKQLGGAAWTLVALLAIPLAARAEVCPKATLSTAAAADLQTQLFSSLEHEDRVTLARVTTTDFTLIERGKRYDRTSSFDLILTAHKAGRRLYWLVTEPRVETSCNLAVMSYVNQGTVIDGDGAPKALQWFETSAFRRTPSGWRAFLVTSVQAVN